jgi:hypothetical protein
MKFKEFLTEETENTMELIQKNCKPFLKEMKGSEILYRGYKDDFSDHVVKTRRKNRKPTNTPVEVQNILDKYFLRYHGWKVRSEGIFATSNYFDAKFYGSAYIFFPIGNYSYIWSPEIKDMYDNIIFEYEKYGKMKKEKLKKLEEDLLDIIKNKFQTNDLKAAIKSENEIMFNVDTYYLVNRKYREQIEEIL